MTYNVFGGMLNLALSICTKVVNLVKLPQAIYKIMC